MASHRKPSAQTYDPRTVKEHIVETPLNEEMSKSFLEYAYSVIYARALPDARDGLKPVQRRIVYQMGEMNLTPDRPYMKSARVVGEVMVTWMPSRPAGSMVMAVSSVSPRDTKVRSSSKYPNS